MDTLKNLDFTVKIKSIITIAALVFAAYVYFDSQNRIERARNNAYLFTPQGDVFVGNRVSVLENREAELKKHLKDLHNLLFELSPNEKLISDKIENQAFYLGDNSIIEFHNRRKEKDFYTDLIRTSSSTEFKMDSIKLDMDSYPYRAMFYGVERVIRKNAIIYNQVTTYNEVTNTKRTDENPHGFSITFKLTEYNEIGYKER